VTQAVAGAEPSAPREVPALPAPANSTPPNRPGGGKPKPQLRRVK
jgi:hypothetical protein